MISKKLEELIIKFITKSISSDELDELSKLLDYKENEEIFYEYIKANYAADFNMSQFNSEKSKLAFFNTTTDNYKEPKRFTISKYYKYAAAAAIILLVSLPSIFKNTISKAEEKTTITNINIEPGTDKAVLTLEDGEEVILQKGEKYNLTNRTADGERLVYNSENTSKTEYNYLTTPRGGQFNVELADGTKVWLNSESKLKYPVAFQKNETRKVELIYGEAYFDVSSSKNHQGTSFKVLNKIQEIEVLGTEFNIKSYQGENEIISTLVEGKVVVDNGFMKKTLNPNEQSISNLKDKEIKINTVDVFDVISWKNGFFSFKEKPLEEIMRVLSRWYDVDFAFENNEIKNINFSGVFNKKQSIEEILLIFEDTQVATFKIENETITVKKNK